MKLDTLAQKETKYDYVAVSEVFGEIGDGVPLITVDLRPGREAERKKALVDTVCLNGTTYTGMIDAAVPSSPLNYVQTQCSNKSITERWIKSIDYRWISADK